MVSVRHKGSVYNFGSFWPQKLEHLGILWHQKRMRTNWSIYGPRYSHFLTKLWPQKLNHPGDFWFQKLILFGVKKSPKWGSFWGQKLPGYGYFCFLSTGGTSTGGPVCLC